MSRPFVEEEAALSDDSDFDSSEDDGLEDDDAALAKEGAGFIADEDDEEEEEEEDAPRKKKRRRHKRALELDDEDLNLVEENTGKKIKRHNKRVFKRQEETAAPVGRDGLAREFGAGGDDYQGLEDFDDEQLVGGNEPWGRDHGPEGSFDDEGGEMDDFIEHDGETNEAEFRAHRRALTKTARAQGISVEAAEEFLDIFGQDAETQQKLDVWYSANEIDHGMEGAADGDGDEVGRPAVDPTLVSRYHLRKEDDDIRDANMPERLFVEMQNDVIPEFHVDDAASYVYKSLFRTDAPLFAKQIVEVGILEVEGVAGESVDTMMHKYTQMDEESLRTFEDQDGAVDGIGGFRLLRLPRRDVTRNSDLPPWLQLQDWRNNEAAQNTLRDCIKTAIRFMFMDSLEVPVLAMFYKEYLGELLCLRDGEVPGLLSREKAEALEKDDVKYLPGAVVAEGRHIRQWDVLWAVYDKAFQYFELTKQQQEKIQQLEKERDIGSIEEGAFDAYRAQFMEAATVDELNEWYQYFHMLLPKKDEDPPEDGHIVQKRPKRASKYQTLVDSGVGSLAGKLVMGTDTFARSVNTISGTFPGMVEQPEVDVIIPDPENEADIHLSARNDSGQAPTAEQVQRCLNSTQFLLIKEIQMHPLIRAKVREIVKRIAVVSTEPTEAGELMLTPFHKYGGIKRIRVKPVEAMLEAYDQYLFMVAAEKEGLIQLRVEVEEGALQQELTTILTRMYTVGVDADMHSSLYTFRSQIIDRVLKDHLVPMALHAVREEMMKIAQQDVTEQCCNEVWIEATTPPLQLKAIDDEDMATGDNMEVVRGQRVCVVCWGDKDRGRLENSTCMVMLDARGYPCDVLTLPQFSGLIPASPPHLETLHEDDRKAEDAAAIVTFLEKHWPHLIVVGTTSPACWQLQEDIKKICEDEITQDKRNENLSPLKNFTVRLVDDKLASIYESCSFAKSDLKDYPRLVRRATGLGRHCIEPLAMLSAMMMSKDDPELLALQVHPLQGLVPNAKRARAYEQLLITAISQEGVCVNSCVQKDWLAAMLQFVPGLGPRKAQAVLKAIKSLPENDDYMSGPVPSQTVVARDHLLATDRDDPDHHEDDEEDPWRVVRLLRHKVYANAAPYLRVTDPNEVHESNDEIFSMKDNMRVHPRDEDALSKIACAALDIADPVEAAEDPIPRAVESPHKVMQVDIGMYDADWQERHGGKESRISTFTDLAMELIKPYGSARPPERLDLTEEQCFWALTGEDRYLLKEGKLVTARVIWVKKDLAGLVTDNGVNCHLSRANVKSEEPQSLEQVLQKGMEIQARVHGIDFTNGGRLQLVSRSDVLADHTHWERVYLQSTPDSHQGDNWYTIISDKERQDAEKAKREMLKVQKHSQTVQRPIKHPRFVNLNPLKVEQALKNPDWNNSEKLRGIPGVDPKGAKEGDFLFYPSRKGTDRVVVCIRLFKRDNTVPVFHHIDLLETKSQKMGNALALGTPLKIQRFPFLNDDETQFEDLDDVGVHFVKKYVSLYDEVIKSRKFLHGDKVQVNSELNQRFKGNAEYCLSLGFHPEGKEPEGQQGVGWGTVAIKTDKGEPKHYAFRICHKGYFGTFKIGRRSELYSSVNRLIEAMKKSMQEKQNEMRAAQAAKEAAARAAAQQHQHYGDYSQMPPPSGGYGGHYGHMGAYGGGHAGFVGNGRGY